MEVKLEEEPPCTDIPPEYGPSKPKREASSLEVCFSMTERAGETWYT